MIKQPKRSLGHCTQQNRVIGFFLHIVGISVADVLIDFMLYFVVAVLAKAAILYFRQSKQFGLSHRSVLLSCKNDSGRLSFRSRMANKVTSWKFLEVFNFRKKIWLHNYRRQITIQNGKLWWTVFND